MTGCTCEYIQPESRPNSLPNITYREYTAEGTLYITITFNEEKRPLEIFLKIGKMGSFEHASLEALGRTLSTALRSNIDPITLAEGLIGITSTPVPKEGGFTLSPQDATGKALKKFMEENHHDRLNPEGESPQ